MSRRLLFCFAILTLAPLLSRASNGSIADGPLRQPTVLQGTVTDSSGAAIPNASVDLENDRSQGLVHTITDRVGRYSLTAPASGTYRVIITAVGFSSVVFANLRISEDAVNLPNTMLQVGSATETIHVREAVEVAGGQIATEGHVGIFGDVSLQQTPFSVQSYTSTFLENQQALTLTDVLGSVASIISMSSSSKASPEADTFLSRGFKMYANTGMAVNGLFGLYADLPDMYFVERVDLFSGPSAFVMGAPESVGGVVNLAPKRAHDGSLLVLEPTYLGTDRTGLYLRQIEGGETHSLSLPETVTPARVESWFPDSMHLIISSWKGSPTDGQSLWKLSVMGGSPRKLVDDGEFARISPDGSQIALMRIVDARPEIWSIRSDGEEARRLISGSISEEEYLGPVGWSPDSKRIAFIRTTVHASGASERKLEIDDIQSGRLDVVFSKPNLMWLVAWPRKTSLVYALYEDAPNERDINLWEVPLDSRVTRISGPAVRLTSGRGWIVGLSNTTDGKILAIRRVEAQPSIYIAELANDRKQMLTTKRLTKENWVDTAFSWTADSKAVLLVSDRDGRQHIYKQALDGTQPELLVAGNHDYELPRLDPTGHDLLYMQMPERGEPSQAVQIRRMSMAGGVSSLVLKAPSIWNYQCARLPSTLCIYSSGSARDLRLHTFNAVTGEGIEMSQSRMNNVENWSLSPDGNTSPRAE